MKKTIFRLFNISLVALSLAAMLPVASAQSQPSTSAIQRKDDVEAKKRCQRCRRGPDGKMICQDVDPDQCKR